VLALALGGRVGPPPGGAAPGRWAVQELLLRPPLTERRDFQHAYTKLYLRSGGIARSPRRWGEQERFPEELELLAGGEGAQVGGRLSLLAWGAGPGGGAAGGCWGRWRRGRGV
jgi:hypothetical protein